MLDLVEYTWLNSNMRLSNDYLTPFRMSQPLFDIDLDYTCDENSSVDFYTAGKYDYRKYETIEKITLWKTRTDSSIEVMYIKMTENLSIGKIVMTATTCVVIILICIYGYRRQRHHAKRRQMEMVWIKVRHSLFV